MKELSIIEEYRLLKDKHRMRAHFAGFCAICMGRYQEQADIVYDVNKEKGKRTAHMACFLKQHGYE